MTEERPYTLDDLVSREKSQMRLVLVVMVVAMIYFAGKRVVGPETERAPGEAAPVVSDR